MTMPSGGVTGTYIGQRVRRKEDFRLLTGRGRYVDDGKFSVALHAAFVRSMHAHARLKKVDASEALALSGVTCVLTGIELAESSDPMTGGREEADFPIRDYPLALEKVRYVGEPVAVVVATDRYNAEDAAERVRVEYEPLPPVVDAEEAMNPGASLLFDELGTNVLFHRTFRYGDVAAAFQGADQVVRGRLYFHRYGSTPIETVGIVASYDAGDDVLTLWINCQVPQMMLSLIGRALRRPTSKLRMIVPADMGGGFGSKLPLHPESIVLGLLAMKVGRPVKWVEDRTEHLLASRHGSEKHLAFECAVKKDGTILGFKARTVDNAGAFLRRPEPNGAILWCHVVQGCYQIRNVEMDCCSVVTNKSPVGPNRGYGRMQHMFLIERMVDTVAHELGLDPVEVRLKNFIQPDQFPYRTTNGCLYDSGDYPGCVRRALEMLEYARWREEQRRARESGRYLGIGVVSIMDPGASNWALRGMIHEGVQITTQGEAATITVDRSGDLLVRVGSQGQSNETVVAQVVASEFGVPFERVHVIWPLDTWFHPFSLSSGTYVSRFAAMASGALQGAAAKLKEKLRRIAAHLWGVGVDETLFQDGQVVMKGNPERALSIRDLAHICLYRPTQLPPGVDPSLEVTFVYNFPLATEITERFEGNFAATYANAVHAAVVEVDPNTGAYRILRYVVVSDVGTMINPTVVEGQIHGTVAHSLGGAGLEEFAYDRQGTPLGLTFTDYRCPAAPEVPEIQVDHVISPSPFTAYGVKGMGEGSGPVPALLAQALEDALRDFKVRITDSRITPERVLKYIRAASSEGHDSFLSGPLTAERFVARS
jgi:2-furoyl-CoA dehydrogenase large subunit